MAMSDRRPRGTPQQAEADIKAAMARLARARGGPSDPKVTATSLAREAGMSRKQLYHYFESAPELAKTWQSLRTQRARRSDTSSATTTRHVQQLEEALAAWKTVAAVTRAEAERQAEINRVLRAENERLRAASVAATGQVVPLPVR